MSIPSAFRYWPSTGISSTRYGSSSSPWYISWADDDRGGARNDMSDQEKSGSHTETIHLPAPTAWPIVLAFGATLLFAGLVTSMWISVLGGILMVSGAVGWFRQVLPHEVHED